MHGSERWARDGDEEEGPALAAEAPEGVAAPFGNDEGPTDPPPSTDDVVIFQR